MSDSDLVLRQLPIGPMDNFSYLIGSRATGECAIVDPAWDAAALATLLEEEDMRLAHVLVTHTHYDHVNGIEELLHRVNGAKVHVHQLEGHRLEGLGSDRSPTHGGEVIALGEVEISVVHTPGHTPGSQCFYVRDNLITGDTLFIGGCGRCDLPGGDPEQMYRTLTGTILALPDHTRVLPGHDYGETPTSTVGEQRSDNPYLTYSDLESFLGYRMRPRR